MSSSEFPAPRVDPSRPGHRYYLLSDALSLSASRYEEFVYGAAIPKVHDVRESPEDDPFAVSYWGKCQPWVPFVFWPWVVAALLIWDWNSVSVGVGLLLWFPLEYFFHQYLFHIRITPMTQRFHLILHGVHHLAPHDLLHIVSPPFELALQVIPISATLYLVGAKHVPSIVAALLIQYLRYDATHWLLHRYEKRQLRQVPLIGTLLGRLKEQHMRHHFHDPRKDFAISFLW